MKKCQWYQRLKEITHEHQYIQFNFRPVSFHQTSNLEERPILTSEVVELEAFVPVNILLLFAVQLKSKLMVKREQFTYILTLYHTWRFSNA